jgi:hypothetical protein
MLSITEDPSPSLADLGKATRAASTQPRDSSPPNTPQTVPKQTASFSQQDLLAPSFDSAKTLPSSNKIEPKQQIIQEVKPETKQPQVPLSSEEARKRQSKYDTLLQFAAVELEGTIQRKPQQKLSLT